MLQGCNQALFLPNVVDGDLIACQERIQGAIWAEGNTIRNCWQDVVIAASAFDQVPDAQCAISAGAESQLAAGMHREACNLFVVSSHDLHKGQLFWEQQSL